MFDHVYNASFIRAISGNTVELLVDLGFEFKIQWRFKLKDFDVPKEESQRCRFFIQSLLKEQEGDIVISSHKEDDSYLAFLHYSLNGCWYNLTDVLLRSGFGCTEV